MTETHWRDVPEPIRPRPSAADLLRRETREDSCEKHGPFTAERFLNIWSRCPKCTEEHDQKIERDRLEYEAQREARLFQQRIDAAGVPPRFVGKSFRDFNAVSPQQKRVLQIVENYVSNFEATLKAGRCLMFLGSVGTGKTLLSSVMVQELLQVKRPAPEGYFRPGFTAYYSTAIGVVRALRDTWRKDSSLSETDVLKKLSGVDLLVIDEIGVQFGSEAELTQLTELIDLRYRSVKPTIAISNLDLAGLERFLGARAVDRLRENGGSMVVFDWKSWRGRKP
jgi:DNA replication protein DnaC